MKTYEISIEPITYTNDDKKKKMEITAKRLDIDKIMKEHTKEIHRYYIDYRVTVKDGKREKTYFFHGFTRTE